MELHQLRYVVAVARTGSFSRAAIQCHITQPSLSQQVQKLEEELGHRLFDRAKSGARLTHIGEAFVQRAQRILKEVAAAQREVNDSQTLNRGHLTIGILPTIAPYFLPKALSPFHRLYPNIQVTVQEDTTDRLLSLVHAYEVDIAIVSLPLSDYQLEIEPLFEEELLLALPKDHTLLTKKSIHMSDIEMESFILMKEGHCLGDQVLNFCARNALQPNISCRSGQIETMKALVEAGLGISLIPAMAKGDPTSSQIKYRSLTNPQPLRQVVAIWSSQRELQKSAAEFLNQLKEILPNTAKL